MALLRIRPKALKNASVLLAVYVEYSSLFIFLFVLWIQYHTGQKRLKRHESSDAESDKGQSRQWYGI